MSSEVRRSIIFLFADKYGTFIIGLAATLILARLLSPSDFGIFAICMAVVALLDVFRDFGIGSYLIQEKEVTTSSMRTVFTTVTALSVLCFVLLFFGSYGIAAFYGDEGALRQVLMLLSVNFLFAPFSIISMSLLRREFAFNVLAVINISTALCNLVVAALLAALGHGVLSFGWAALAASILRIAIACIMRPCFTAFRFSFADWRKVAHFGTFSTATAIINVLHENLPQFIIGRMLGFGAVGLLGRAVTLCQLPDRLVISALNPLILPALADRNRRGFNLKPTYLLALAHVSALQWPALLGIALFAEPLVPLLFGSQWLEVVPLVRIMALASLVMFPAVMTYPTLVALGRIRDTLSMSLISLPPSIALVIAASPFGLEAVAATQFVTLPLQVFVAISFIKRRIDLSWREVALAVRASLIVTLCAMTMPVLVVALQGGLRIDMPLANLLLAVMGAAAGWGAGLFLSKHPLLDELRRGFLLAGRQLGWLRAPSVGRMEG